VAATSHYVEEDIPFKGGDFVKLIKEDEWSKKDGLILGDIYKIRSDTYLYFVVLEDKTFTYSLSQFEAVERTVPQYNGPALALFKKCIDLVSNGYVPDTADYDNLNDDYMCDFELLENLDDEYLSKLKEDALTAANDSTYTEGFRTFSNYIITVIQRYFDKD